ncbi:MAG: Na+/H+ antiporter NhaC family protein, partial [Anaerovoracaceae bacterium]
MEDAVINYGAISLIPVLVVIATAIITKRATESLILGTLVGAALIAKQAFWKEWFDTLSATIGDNVFYIVMFGMFGAFIRMLDMSGAALGFSSVGSKVANSRGKTLMFAWVLGIIIFIDDYLNALGVGVAVKPLSDKWKVPREFLAFVVNCTGAAVCVLIPVSTWAIFYATQIDKLKMFELSGAQMYLKSIPFMFYAWIAVIMVPFFIFKIIPTWGPMNKAELRAETENKMFPEWFYANKEGEEKEVSATDVKPSSPFNFIIPMIVLVVMVFWKEDIVLAVIIATIVLFLMLAVQKLMNLGQFCDAIVGGFGDMLYVTMLVLAAFVLQAINDKLGLTPFVIEAVEPILSPALFPVIIFIVIALLAFATGSFWGIAAISFPIIMPLAEAMGVSPYMAIGVIAAGTAFG